MIGAISQAEDDDEHLLATALYILSSPNVATMPPPALAYIRQTCLERAAELVEAQPYPAWQETAREFSEAAEGALYFL